MNFKIVIFILKSWRNRNPNRKMAHLYAHVRHFSIWIAIYPSISEYIYRFYFKIEIGWFQIAICPFYNSICNYTVIANIRNIYLNWYPSECGLENFATIKYYISLLINQLFWSWPLGQNCPRSVLEYYVYTNILIEAVYPGVDWIWIVYIYD